MTLRSRFAPSPTGYLHIGGARTALYCWLAARHAGGRFLLRIEDTDRERSTEEAIRAILDGLAWLGLDWDEGPVFQSSRLARYREVAEALVRAGKAYYAYETREELEAMREAALARGEKPRYNGYWRDRGGPPREDPNRVIRFKNPLSGSVVFHDLVKGRIEWRNEELDDLVLIRADGYPTYNFAVVVDDLDMGITEVIRGDDHVNNTPRQINIYEALGARPPRFAHLPMILGPDGSKLSKRHGAVSVLAYRDEGFLPQALLNYLLRLGWSHGDQEVFSREEMIALFSLAGVHRSPARFDPEKLRWLNQVWMKRLDPAEVAPHLAWQLRALGLDPGRGPEPAAVVRALADRVHTLREMAERARVWYEPLAGYQEEAAARHLTPAGAALLRAARARLAALADWSPPAIEAELKALAAEHAVGLGRIAQPLRVAITGGEVSPAIDHTVFLAGREEALARIDRAIARAEAAAMA